MSCVRETEVLPLETWFLFLQHLQMSVLDTMLPDWRTGHPCPVHSVILTGYPPRITYIPFRYIARKEAAMGRASLPYPPIVPFATFSNERNQVFQKEETRSHGQIIP